MITYIRFDNFYSYPEPTEVSFTLGKQPTESNYDFYIDTTHDQYRLNKVTAILGANGSGKTQLLKAVSFLRWFICGSTSSLDSEDNIPYSPFAMSKDKESDFELGFLLKNADGVYEEYRYELTLSQSHVINEALYKKTSRLFSYVFSRHYDGDKMTYKHRSFVIPSLADDVKKNTSLISYANLLDEPLAEAIIEMFEGYKTNVVSIGRLGSLSQSIPEMTELFAKDDGLKQTAEKLLCQFDTGIDEINIKSVMMVNEGSSKKYFCPLVFIKSVMTHLSL